MYSRMYIVHRHRYNLVVRPMIHGMVHQLLLKSAIASCSLSDLDYSHGSGRQKESVAFVRLMIQAMIDQLFKKVITDSMFK
jgi:hypothetical protein